MSADSISLKTYLALPVVTLFSPQPSIVMGEGAVMAGSSVSSKTISSVSESVQSLPPSVTVIVYCLKCLPLM
jgi:hypothetical protein